MKGKKDRKKKQKPQPPHQRILRLQASFETQKYEDLSLDILTLENSIQQQQQFLDLLNYHSLELESTGKKDFPRIILKPDFIATQSVKVLVKEYYRKSSNTFLHMNILRFKSCEKIQPTLEKINSEFQKLKEKRINAQKLMKQHKNRINIKKRANLKLELKLQSLLKQQLLIKSLIENQKEDQGNALKEYELKVNTYENRCQHSENLLQQIQEERKKIHSKYNPSAYSEYLKQLSYIDIKNLRIKLNLWSVKDALKKESKEIVSYQQFLQSKTGVFMMGRTRGGKYQQKKSYNQKSFGTFDIHRSTSQMNSPIKHKTPIKHFHNTPSTILSNQPTDRLHKSLDITQI